MKANKQNDLWDAKHYKKHSKPQFKKGILALQNIKFNGTEYVLDVGCGDGRITAQIAQSVSNGYVLGIDISQNMITEAINNFSNIKNLEFKCADITKFSSGKKFDLVVSFSAFHWVNNQKKALENIFNILKPEGRLEIRMSGKYKGAIDSVFEMPKWATILKNQEETYFSQTPETLTKLLESTGFKKIRVNQEIKEKIYKDKEEIFNWAFAWVPHATGLPENKAREFTDDIVKSVCNTQSDNKLSLKSRHIEAFAIK
jgi:trans-aconitate methyltransferase